MTVGRKKVVGRGTDVKQSKTMLANFPKNSVQFSIRKDNAVTLPNTFAGTAQNFPCAFTHPRCKEDLDVA